MEDVAWYLLTIVACVLERQGVSPQIQHWDTVSCVRHKLIDDEEEVDIVRYSIRIRLPGLGVNMLLWLLALVVSIMLVMFIALIFILLPMKFSLGLLLLAVDDHKD